MDETQKKKICFIATLELSVKVFLTEHMRRMQKKFDLSVAVSTDNLFFLEPYGVDVRIIPIKIERDVDLMSDVKSLFYLYRLFKRERFSIIHSIMPKSGLLSMVAGLLAMVPIRVHTFTGQVWKNSTGLRRFILKTMDRILAMCATRVLVDSHSQREFLIAEGVVSRKKSFVIAHGSICGVDIERFRFNAEARGAIREEYGVKPCDIVFCYLGRMKRDKGVLDLARAFSVLCGKYQSGHLLVVGPDEEGIDDEIKKICAQHAGKVHTFGYTKEPEKYMSAADVFCLPSYREGFGLVIAEAGAVGIPSIGSKIYGIVDIVEDGVTGYLFEPAAYFNLMQKMSKFMEDPSLIRTMGKKARLNVLEKYTKEKVVSAMASFYEELEKSL